VNDWMWPVPVVTNGWIVDAKPDRGRPKRRAAVEKPDGRHWVGLRQPAHRTHRRRAVVEGTLPGSCRSRTPQFDPYA